MRRCQKCGRKFLFRPGALDFVDRCGQCEAATAETSGLIAGFAVLTGLAGMIFLAGLWLTAKAISALFSG